jgi:hypothetical protein
VATTIDSTALFFGPPASLTVGGTEVGATLTPPKVTVEATQYAPEFQGAGGPISGAVFNTKIKATVEFDVNEITAAKLAWAMPGSSSVVGTAATTGGGGTGTLYADVAAGATNIKVTSVANLTAGDYLKIGDAGEEEIHRIAVGGVGTINGGTGITLETPLLRAHDAGDDYVEVDDAGTTVITWSTGRVPSATFKDVIIDGLGVDGRHLKVTVSDALSDGKLNVEMSDAVVAGSHVIMTGFYDGATPTLCPVSIEIG